MDTVDAIHTSSTGSQGESVQYIPWWGSIKAVDHIGKDLQAVMVISYTSLVAKINKGCNPHRSHMYELLVSHSICARSDAQRSYVLMQHHTASRCWGSLVFSCRAPSGVMATPGGVDSGAYSTENHLWGQEGWVCCSIYSDCTEAQLSQCKEQISFLNLCQEKWGVWRLSSQDSTE